MINTNRVSISRFVLALLVCLQGAYAGAEYSAEIQKDHEGHLYIEVAHYEHSGHADHSAEHQTEETDHSGHCHGQIHSYLNPAISERYVTQQNSLLPSDYSNHYRSIHSPPNLRPPTLPASLT